VSLSPEGKETQCTDRSKYSEIASGLQLAHNLQKVSQSCPAETLFDQRHRRSSMIKLSAKVQQFETRLCEAIVIGGIMPIAGDEDAYDPHVVSAVRRFGRLCDCFD
jgi:hypothetical protein